MGGDGGHILSVRLGHSLRRGSGILTGGDLHILTQLFQIGRALADGLGMGEDLLDVLQLSALLGHQVMVNFQAGGADNFEAAVAEHQIINLLDGARGAVFQGKHPIVTEPVLNGTKHTLEAAEIHHLGVLEEFFTGQLGVGHPPPLARPPWRKEGRGWGWMPGPSISLRRAEGWGFMAF